MSKVARKSKNQLRREKQKLRKLEVDVKSPTIDDKKPPIKKEQSTSIKKETKLVDTLVADHEVENEDGKIFQSELDRVLENPEFAQFKHVFDRFHTEADVTPESTIKGEIMESDDEDFREKLKDSDDEDQSIEPKISKKKLRKQKKIPLSELKAYSKHPELVQWYDVDAADPKLVVDLKAHKNYVPVPIHWQFKREYLSGRRGYEKKAFTLPKYITDTGITDMRDTTKEDEKSLKQISREKVQPKMNRLDMDYQRLYDAFFKFQTKPRLYGYGEIFFEGKETEELVDYSKYKPGIISDELREALGLPKGITPPWVLKMQHIGPPPSYPGLKIPGFNVTIDEYDNDTVKTEPIYQEDVIREPFGKLLEIEESEEEEEEEEQEVENDDEDEGENAPVTLAEEDIISFNKPAVEEVEKITYEKEEPSDEEDVPLAEIVTEQEAKDKTDIEPKKLYQILKEKVTSDSGFLSSGLVYDVPTESSKRKSEESGQASKRQKTTPEKAQRSQKSHDNTDDDDEDDEDAGKFKF